MVTRKLMIAFVARLVFFLVVHVVLPLVAYNVTSFSVTFALDAMKEFISNSRQNTDNVELPAEPHSNKIGVHPTYTLWNHKSTKCIAFGLAVPISKQRCKAYYSMVSVHYVDFIINETKIFDTMTHAGNCSADSNIALHNGRCKHLGLCNAYNGIEHKEQGSILDDMVLWIGNINTSELFPVYVSVETRLRCENDNLHIDNAPAISVYMGGQNSLIVQNGLIDYELASKLECNSVGRFHHNGCRSLDELSTLRTEHYSKNLIESFAKVLHDNLGTDTVAELVVIEDYRTFTYDSSIT